MPKYRVWVATNRVGSKCETTVYLDEEDASDPKVLDEICRQIAFDELEWGYYKVEDDEADE